MCLLLPVYDGDADALDRCGVWVCVKKISQRGRVCDLLPVCGGGENVEREDETVVVRITT